MSARLALPLPSLSKRRSKLGAVRSLVPGLLLCGAVTLAATLLQAVEERLFGRAWLEALVLGILIGTAVRTAWTPSARPLAVPLIHFCPDIAAAPDGRQVWLTLKDVGRTLEFNAAAPFEVPKVIDIGPITNHVNFVRNAEGQFAYVTVGGLSQVKVFNTDGYQQVAAIDVGALPHGLWPSGDGSRVYVGLENADGAAVIDTAQQADRLPSRVFCAGGGQPPRVEFAGAEAVPGPAG